MTNILKDVWEDRSRGACWLPQEVFTPPRRRSGPALARGPGPGFDAGMRELIGVAHAHLRNALDYTLLIPGKRGGNPALLSVGDRARGAYIAEKSIIIPALPPASQVKISRSAVSMTRLLTDLSVRNDWMLRRLFAQAARGLPLARLAEVRRPQPGAPSRAPAERAASIETPSARAAAPTGVPGHEPHRPEARTGTRHRAPLRARTSYRSTLTKTVSTAARPGASRTRAMR